jgi:hypothetical protein
MCGDKKINFNAEPPDAGHEFHELTRIVLTQRRKDAKTQRATSPKDNSPGQSESASAALGLRPQKFPAL